MNEMRMRVEIILTANHKIKYRNNFDKPRINLVYLYLISLEMLV